MKYKCSVNPNGNDELRGEPELVVDCAGNPIEGGSGDAYSLRCSVGNLEDYVKDYKEYMVEEISAPSVHSLIPLPINIVVPIYSSGRTIIKTIKSLLNSSLGGRKAEVTFFLNESKNSSPEIVRNNDISYSILSYIFRDGGIIEGEIKSILDELRRIYVERREDFQINIIRKTLNYGLMEVYQRSISSHLNRLWNYAESLSEAGNRKEVLVKEIDEIETNTILLFLDDDIILKEGTVSNIYRSCVENKSISVGRLNITDVVTPNADLKQALKIIMGCWIEFKEAFGLNIFSPRGATLGSLHHNHKVGIVEDYADQKIFAQLRGKGKRLYHTEIDTIIAESDIPSNGYFMKRIRLYLEGEITDFNKLRCIRNVLDIYKARRGNNSYNLQEVSDFFRLLKERNIAEIISAGERLLEKKIIYCQ